MAEGLNRATLCGFLGADPELKYTGGGQAVLRLRVATTESYKDKSGERKESTEWHTCNLWGPRAEALNKILSKGKQVLIEGRIQTRSWEDKDGGKRHSTEINVSNVILCGGGQRREDSGSGGFGGGVGKAGDYHDDEIPF